jgi:hypothetical protein
MDNALNALFSWQFLLFSLGIFTVIWIIRTVVEYFIPTAVGSKLWEKLILPVAPPLVGGLVALFAVKYAYPAELTSSLARVFFGAVSGNFSGTVYQIAKGMLKDKLQSFKSTVVNTTETPTTTIVESKSTIITDKTDQNN